MSNSRFLLRAVLLVVGVNALTTLALAQATQEAAAPMQLPNGWTAEDMQAMMSAATPGEMHKHLAGDVGTWTCKTQMWMMPGGEPVSSGGTSKVTPLLDGRFIMCEMKGEMPGMGPFNGLGIYGFDNVSQKFVANWLDNMGTGIMNGTGELSADGKTLTWEFTGNCPITKKPMVMREVETVTGPNTKTLEMFGPDPKTGKEFKMMEIQLTRE
ncbi:MAG: DUF1579 domain-containing protein [Bythopirellula sp.]|nr:DUF1579 domain-containing protein [Bythopirellula sp.]